MPRLLWDCWETNRPSGSFRVGNAPVIAPNLELGLTADRVGTGSPVTGVATPLCALVAPTQLALHFRHQHRLGAAERLHDGVCGQQRRSGILGASHRPQALA